jgi:hypothetical protein
MLFYGEYHRVEAGDRTIHLDDDDLFIKYLDIDRWWRKQRRNISDHRIDR